jgi:hypothetical protein
MACPRRKPPVGWGCTVGAVGAGAVVMLRPWFLLVCGMLLVFCLTVGYPIQQSGFSVYNVHVDPYLRCPLVPQALRWG